MDANLLSVVSCSAVHLLMLEKNVYALNFQSLEQEDLKKKVVAGFDVTQYLKAYDR